MHTKTARLSEKPDSIAYFTVQFWNGWVQIRDSKQPLGQISTDMLNLEEQFIFDLRLKNDMLFEKVTQNVMNPSKALSPELIAGVQDMFNESMQTILTLPLYRDLNLKYEEWSSLFVTAYRSNPQSFEAAVKTQTKLQSSFVGLVHSVCMIPDEIITFNVYTKFLLTDYLDRCAKRDSQTYAIGVYDFFSNEEVQKDISSLLPPSPDFSYRQAHPAKFEYVTMPSPDDQTKYVIAERMEFRGIGSFLHADFYRALIHGNAPRKCQNCGRYFLLTKGYNTCYCNNIAPGETTKTCRKVGAHRKQAKTEGKTPAQIEYAKTYNRLKTQKSRGKITTQEWNNSVAKALEYKEKAEKGKLTDVELKQLLKEL